jgi:hypothetical protein
VRDGFGSFCFGQEQQSENFAFISSVEGHVLLQEEQAKENQYIFKNDWIVTEKGTQVRIRFGEDGGYLLVEENSKVFFIEMSSEKSVLALFHGMAYLCNLENVELRAAGKPEGKIVFAQKDQIISVNIIGSNVEVESFEGKVIDGDINNEPIKANTDLEKEKHIIVCLNDYMSFWRFYGPCFSWYPGWCSWYPVYYSYGYYYGYYNHPYQNQYDYSSNGNYSRGNSTRQVVTKNQLQRRQITVRPSRMNLNSVRSMKNVASQRVASFPSRISNLTARKYSNRSFKSSSTSRIQLKPTSSYRTPAQTNSRGTTIRSRSSSPSANRSANRSVSRPTGRSASGKSTSGSVRKK